MQAPSGNNQSMTRYTRYILSIITTIACTAMAGAEPLVNGYPLPANHFKSVVDTSEALVKHAYESARENSPFATFECETVASDDSTELIDKMKEEKGVKQDVELTADDLKALAGQFKAEYKEKIGEDFPTDPKEQLMGAIKAVFRSWDNPRANVYRRDNDIPYSWGTAVNVQMMAFGNMGDDCGTGVAFTRDRLQARTVCSASS